jgi:hypothetical protein
MIGHDDDGDDDDDDDDGDDDGSCSHSATQDPTEPSRDRSEMYLLNTQPHMPPLTLSEYRVCGV